MLHQLRGILLAGLFFFVVQSAVADLDDSTHAEIDPIKFDIGPGGKIETMAMDAKGRLLCGVSFTAGDAGGESRPPNRSQPRRPQYRKRLDAGRDEPREYAIKVVDDAGKIVATWPMKTVHPKMIHGSEDGTIYVGGHGKLAQLSAEGKLLKLVETSVLAEFSPASTNRNPVLDSSALSNAGLVFT